MDRKYHDRAEKVMRSDKESIFDHREIGVDDTGNERKHIHENDDVNDRRGNDQSQQQRPENGRDTVEIERRWRTM